MNKKMTTTKIALALAAFSCSEVSAMAWLGEKLGMKAAKTAVKKGEKETVGAIKKASVKKLTASQVEKNAVSMVTKSELEAVKKSVRGEMEKIFASLKANVTKSENALNDAKKLGDTKKIKAASAELKKAKKTYNTEMKAKAEVFINNGENELKAVKQKLQEAKNTFDKPLSSGSGGPLAITAGPGSERKVIEDLAKDVKRKEAALAEMKKTKNEAEKGLSSLGLTKNQTIAAAVGAGAVGGAGIAGGTVYALSDHGQADTSASKGLTLAERLN